MKPEHVVVAMDYFSRSAMKFVPKFETEEDLLTLADLWCEMLEDVPGGIFIKACKTIMSTQSEFPSLSEIREKCLLLMHGFQDSGTAVFDRLKPEMFRVSHVYVSSEERKRVMCSITDPAAKRAAEVFDWRACGMDKSSNLGIHRAQFAKLYEHYASEEKFKRDSERISSGVRKLSGNNPKKIGEVNPA